MAATNVVPGESGELRVIYLAQVPGDRFTLVDRTIVDSRSAMAFYREVAGLTIAPGPSALPMMEEHRGNRFDSGQEEDGGQSADHQPIWIAYVGVDDVDFSAARANELGGQVLMPPTELPGFGRAAVLRDSQGLAFGIFTRARA